MGLLLGKGGYGSVYHATLFGTQVAVKVRRRLCQRRSLLPCMTTRSRACRGTSTLGTSRSVPHIPSCHAALRCVMLRCAVL